MYLIKILQTPSISIELWPRGRAQALLGKVERDILCVRSSRLSKYHVVASSLRLKAMVRGHLLSQFINGALAGTNRVGVELPMRTDIA